MLLFWQACIHQLQKELTPQQFKAWITPLSAEHFDEDAQTLRILAPSRIKADAVAKQFGERFQSLAQEYWGKPVQVVFSIKAKASVTPALSPNKSMKQAATHVSDVLEAIVTADVNAPKAKKINKHQSHLDAGLNFDNLVSGKANNLPKMVALEVVEQPGKKYNPFFIYGSVGVGKTHLMHAIGNAFLEHNPDKNVRYLFANTYVSEIVKAYQNNRFEEFKQYYQDLDMLLIDDIQFFGDGNKEGTQVAFFQLFETLIRDNKQIIITSDRYPKALEGIQERLRSRFESGISIEIEPPELEMRVAILLKKAELEKVNLPEDVAFFMAKLLRTNVRELEGALRKVIAYARFNKQKITLEGTKASLKDLLNNNQEHISVEMIQKVVADFYKIKISDMHSKARPRNIAHPRQIAMYLTKELTQKSLPEIGERFGGRDHTTVLHAVRKITEQERGDTQLHHELKLLGQLIKG